jgi:hypothetical protein
MSGESVWVQFSSSQVVIVIGTLTILLVGLLVSRFRPAARPNDGSGRGNR